ncbi:MAG TPA: MCP four helix bundle domain-containing protein, partial [Bacteroidales bacterium]
MFKKMKIRTKLLLSILIIAFINIVIVYIAALSIKKIAAYNKAMFETTTLPMDYCVDISSLFQQMHVDVTTCVVKEKKDEIQSALDHFYHLSNQFDSAMQKYTSTLFDETDKQNYENVKAVKGEYVNLMQEIVPLALKNDDVT